MAGGQIASGVASRTVFDGTFDGYSIPQSDLDTRLEVLRREPLDEMTDDVLRLLVLVEILFDVERQEGDLVRERRRKQIVGVQIAYGCKNIEHLPMEFELTSHRCGGGFVQAALDQAQPLHRIHPMHGSFQRQMNVVFLDEEERLLDQPLALVE